MPIGKNHGFLLDTGLVPRGGARGGHVQGADRPRWDTTGVQAPLGHTTKAQLANRDEIAASGTGSHRLARGGPAPLSAGRCGPQSPRSTVAAKYSAGQLCRYRMKCSRARVSDP